MKTKKQADRKAIIISAALTALILSGVGSAALASNWLNSQGAQTTPQPAIQPPPIVVTVEPIYDNSPAQALAVAPQPAAQQAAGGDQVAAAYQAQLDQAYQALEEAYAQIETLQSAQVQAAEQPAYHDDDERESNGGREQEEGDHGHDQHEEHDDD